MEPRETESGVGYNNLAIQMEHVRDELAEVRKELREVAQTLNRIALVEKDQLTTNQQVERAFKEIDKLSDRVKVLEIQAPMNKQASSWLEKAVLGGFGILVLVVLAKVGLHT